MTSPANIDEDLVRDSLECAICKDFFNEPKQLVCGHTFCRNCIERLDKVPQQRHHDFREDICPFGNVDFAVQCPQCRDLCVIPYSGLSTNYVVKEMVEKFRDIGVSHHPLLVSTNEESNTIPCETCTRQILQVEMFLCNSCTKEQNRDKKIFLCSFCVVTRGHKDHEIIIYTELASKEDRETVIDRVMAIGNTARIQLEQTMKAMSINVIKHISNVHKQLNSQFEYFNTLRKICADTGTNLSKQDLENKITQAEALAARIEQSYLRLSEVESEFVRSFATIFSSIERFNNQLQVPQNSEPSRSRNLIDFEAIPSSSSVVDLLVSPNRFSYNNDELDKKQRRVVSRRRPRRVGNNVANDENASPIVLD